MKPLHLPPPTFNLVWFNHVDSTNLLMQRRMEAWEGSGRMTETLVVAGSQWAGRGRGRREWVSPEGGLYATWLGWVNVKLLWALPMAAALALAEALEVVVPGLQVRVKWPNDLLVGEKKVGGILAQARVTGEVAGVVLGFGSNLASTPVVAAAEIGPTSLAEWGWRGEPTVTAVAIAVDCVTRLRQHLSGVEKVREAWVARSVHRPGDRMGVRAGEEVVRGLFRGFGAAGQLHLEVNGETREFHAADLLATS